MQSVYRENWLRCPACRNQYTIGPPLRDPAGFELVCPCCGISSSALDLFNTSMLEELELVEAVLKLRGVVMRLSGVDLLSDGDSTEAEDDLIWSADCRTCDTSVQASDDIQYCPLCGNTISGLRQWFHEGGHNASASS